uniref:Patched domain-containing protein 3 n=1 Tax=Ascaris suum TaxID=6253 RepID=F1KV12_ASCSU
MRTEIATAENTHNSGQWFRRVADMPNPFGMLQDVLAAIFYRYALYVSSNPRPFIVVPVLLTFALSLGVFTFTVQDDLRFLYSPIHSPARFEYSIHRAFSGDSINSTYIAVAVEPNDNINNLLRKEIFSEILDLNNFILNNLTFMLNGRIYNFGTDICSRIALCPLSNTIVQFFFDAFWNKQLRDDPRVRLEYPLLYFFDNKFFLPLHLYGVELGGEKGIKSIEMIHLHYPIPGTENESAESVGDALEMALREYLASSDNRLIKTSMFSLSMLKNEMNKNARYTFPFISLTILLLVSFTVFSCMTGDWITSKPLEALMGVLSSSFAIISGAGLMFLLGVPFVSQVTVMPFLALAIGVDDTYVMLGAWQDTKRSLPPSKRMGLTLEEAGSAITVTSITSMLSFGIGAFSTTPAISIFCRFIAVAIMFDWFYQVTFFAAVMALGGKREAAGYHCILVWKKMPEDQIQEAKRTNFVSPTHNLFGNYIAPFLCHRFTRISLIGVYALYIFGAFYGCSLLTPNLTPSRLLVDDSPLTHYLKLAESKIWSEGVIGRVYVNNAPDFSADPKQIDVVLKMVEELEGTPFSIGINSTQLWLRDFLNYRQFFDSNDEQFYETLQSFLKVSFNSHWNSYLQWDNHPTKVGKKYVKRFFFSTAFKIKDWNVRTALLLQWRNITRRYPQFEALVFDENNFYSDQMLELQSTTLSSLGTAIIAMIVVCILFIGDSAIVFWVVFTMISMDIGIAGFLSLWGADLDPTTVVNILMSIGLCIDFATHVGYRIYRSECTDPDERISDALGAIGWPVVQGGVSTFLAIIVMMLVPSHVVRMFARTSILVVLTGLFHGVIILPVIIRSFASNPAEGMKAIR